jgi:hypothetical protein
LLSAALQPWGYDVDQFLLLLKYFTYAACPNELMGIRHATNNDVTIGKVLRLSDFVLDREESTRRYELAILVTPEGTLTFMGRG